MGVGALLLVALVAAATAGSRKKNGAGAGTTPMQTQEGASEGVLPPPMPKDGISRLIRRYKRLSRRCFNKMPGADRVEIKACVLRTVYPDAQWPPPPYAHQWQRNAFHLKAMDDYITSLFPPIS